jgi:hypothetical protein
MSRDNAGGLPRTRAVDVVVRRAGGSVLTKAVPGAVRSRLRREVVRRNTQRPRLAAPTRARLQEIYRDDIRALEGLLGRDLSAWLAPSSR